MDRETWCAAVHGVSKSRTRLSDRTEMNCGEYNSPLKNECFSGLSPQNTCFQGKAFLSKEIINSWERRQNLQEKPLDFGGNCFKYPCITGENVFFVVVVIYILQSKVHRGLGDPFECVSTTHSAFCLSGQSHLQMIIPHSVLSESILNSTSRFSVKIF